MFWIRDEAMDFPPVELTSAEGLLAIGGTLSTERVLLAYRRGIFPWYNEDEPPCWWCPDPRFVLFPDKLKVSKSMLQVLKKPAFTFTTNQAFRKVIEACRNQPRPGQSGTWINTGILKTYTELHGLGHAHSAETWYNGQLVGGLYGIRIGNLFFGESMFSKVSNASKYAFINYVQRLKKEGVILIDCQVYSQHLESLGAEMIPRALFLNYLREGGVES